MIELKRDRAVMNLPRELYSEESLRAGALALGDRARVFLVEKGKAFEAELHPARRSPPQRLKVLAGEFLNEALSHLYRQKVIRSNRELSGPVAARLLAKGFPLMPPDPLEQMEPQVKIDRERDIAQLMDQARRLTS